MNVPLQILKAPNTPVWLAIVGLLITILLSSVTFAYDLGQNEQRVTSLEKDLGRTEELIRQTRDEIRVELRALGDKVDQRTAQELQNERNRK